MTYSEAINKLEDIVRQIDSNELEVDRLAEKIKEANALITFCTERLTKAETEVSKLLADDKPSEG